MATTTLSVNPTKITVSGTGDNDINFDNVLSGYYGMILVDNISAPVKFNVLGSVDGTNSASYTSGDKIIFEAKRGRTLHYKGNAGGETFNVSVLT